MIFHKILETSLISLRAVETADADILLTWENNSDIWHVSETLQPFSRNIIERYVENAFEDIYSAKQLRLMIESKSDNQTIGMVDLFDFNPKNLRAGIGIFIHSQFENKGFAQETITCIKRYAKEMLNLHQLYAEMTESNVASLTVFKNSGFEVVGIKKDWMKTPSGYENQIFMQVIL